MGLYVYDHGYRIQTPKEALFPPGGVNSLQQSKESHRSADIEDRLHADGEKFVLPGKPQQNAQDNATKAYTETAEKTTVEQDDRGTLTISHIMVDPVHTTAPSTPIRTAWQRMQSLNISHLVVAQDDLRPMGLISSHDLLEAGNDSLSSIEAIYSKQLIAASTETLVRDVAQSFIEHNINAMPVVDSDDKIVGIVCRTDLLRLLVSGPHLERWV